MATIGPRRVGRGGEPFDDVACERLRGEDLDEGIEHPIRLRGARGHRRGVAGSLSLLHAAGLLDPSEALFQKVSEGLEDVAVLVGAEGVVAVLVENGVFVAGVGAKLVHEGPRGFDAYGVQVDGGAELDETRANVTVLGNDGACVTFVRSHENRNKELLFGFEVGRKAGIECRPGKAQPFAVVVRARLEHVVHEVLDATMVVEEVRAEGDLRGGDGVHPERQSNPHAVSAKWLFGRTGYRRLASSQRGALPAVGDRDGPVCVALVLGMPGHR